MYDIEGYITRNFEDYKYYGNPVSDISICCPFCVDRGAGDPDTKFHLNVHLDADKQVVHCFRCGYSASWIQFIITYSGVTYWQAIGELYVTPRVRSDLSEHIKEKFTQPIISTSSKSTLPYDFRLLEVSDKTRLAKVAKNYLRRRGFGKAVWKRYSLGIADSIGYRVIIPIEDGYWQARALYSYITPKYINPVTEARGVLFNSRALEIYAEVVICEGFFSAISVGDNAIALIGKEPTTEKIRRLVKSSCDVYIIALEANAFNTMQRLADALSRAGKRVSFWVYETGDPADSVPSSKVSYDLKTKLSMLLE